MTQCERVGWDSGDHFILELCVLCMATVKSRLWTPGEARRQRSKRTAWVGPTGLPVPEL